MTPPRAIPLDVFWDPICPWCLIGLARLDAARAANPDLALRLRWRPFRLNPRMPREGMDRRAYLEAKFGGPEGAARVYGHIAETARAEGLAVDLDAVTRTPDTTDAHRLTALAAEEGRADALATALFDAYFRRGEDIGERATLAAVAARAGLDPDAARALLDGDRFADAVPAAEAEARALGVSGVPAYLLAGRPLPGGALPAEAWSMLFARLRPAA